MAEDEPSIHSKDAWALFGQLMPPDAPLGEYLSIMVEQGLDLEFAATFERAVEDGKMTERQAKFGARYIWNLNRRADEQREREADEETD